MLQSDVIETIRRGREKYFSAENKLTITKQMQELDKMHGDVLNIPYWKFLQGKTIMLVKKKGRDIILVFCDGCTVIIKNVRITEQECELSGYTWIGSEVYCVGMKYEFHLLLYQVKGDELLNSFYFTVMCIDILLE